ncbi:MAG: [FeFe] hydrogenase H-cluster radical SAM maturase HydE [Candidatus Omnitrophica bacterium 4484_70.1]|nr:MAG: [FeFe] hydrogenase H-cluster radical SAM maturase HydE [Candidatus Omnitrophica bacterium 4484_70.1]
MNKKEILESLVSEDSENLFKKADEVRKLYCGDEVYIRGIIEFSNYCVRNCLYCGLRRDNKRIKRYRMREEEIIEIAKRIISQGVKTIVLQSGDDLVYKRDSICRIIKRIKKIDDVAVTLSIGERPWDDYKAFREAGADRYLLKQETINEKLYEYLHPGQSLMRRIKILEYLKKLGYQIGAGNIVGLPRQTFKDLADDIIFLKDLEVDMAGIGPFIPQKNTPLGNFPSPPLDLPLKVLALTRIVTENAHLPATTALKTLSPSQGQLLALKAGANVIMPDFTPSEFGKNYKIYDGKSRVTLSYAEEIIFKAGRKVSLKRGDSLKNTIYEKKMEKISNKEAKPLLAVEVGN